MIINVRGTNGSGKSTVAKTIIDRYGGRPDHSQPIYEVPLTRKLTILGSYHTACGGCDTIKTVKEVIDRATAAARYGDVLFEGILISTTYGAVGEWSTQYGDDFVFAFMSTPLDTCIARVEARRRAAGNLKTFNCSGLVQKFATIEKVHSKVYREGRHVLRLNVDDPVSDILGLLL